MCTALQQTLAEWPMVWPGVLPEQRASPAGPAAHAAPSCAGQQGAPPAAPVGHRSRVGQPELHLRRHQPWSCRAASVLSCILVMQDCICRALCACSHRSTSSPSGTTCACHMLNVNTQSIKPGHACLHLCSQTCRSCRSASAGRAAPSCAGPQATPLAEPGPAHIQAKSYLV